MPAAIILLIIVFVGILYLLTPYYEKIGKLFVTRVKDSKKEEEEEIELPKKKENKSGENGRK